MMINPIISPRTHSRTNPRAPLMATALALGCGGGDAPEHESGRAQERALALTQHVRRAPQCRDAEQTHAGQDVGIGKSQSERPKLGGGVGRRQREHLGLPPRGVLHGGEAVEQHSCSDRPGSSAQARGVDHGIDHKKKWLSFPYDSAFLRSHYRPPAPRAAPAPRVNPMHLGRAQTPRTGAGADNGVAQNQN
jgi:hypothetical protein